jgi:hypothetical protein
MLYVGETRIKDRKKEKMEHDRFVSSIDLLS